MAKDRLYLLRPDFTDGSGPRFCSECAMVEGMLGFYPALREKVDVRYVGFTRPRPELVAELGPEHQSSPCLVIGDPQRAANPPPGVHPRTANGHAFLDDPLQVCEYLAQAYGTGRPH